ncbi:nucleotide-binding, alpha-beta plait [Pochonia chlamydosporia 170]|uniref:Nucleotide-binding, alpha-beta plait n=1 Tax=Pochonia chlamydosporia 170 TaxID=1380566 RepID=A0A179FNL7_METCM|nr:nucleotide-binding, alpha-beta plait [Pochonia chlamydosporia 170]OAQ67174.1 nucleotide-binding, alpha-beta plait [Pochonia chlamydosporia 170]
MASRSRSPSRDRQRSLTRSMSPRSDDSRSPRRRRSYDSRSPSRSMTPPPRRNGRYRSNSRSRSRGRGRDSRDGSSSPLTRSTKIVVERLSKNINEDHLYEIFGQFGPIKDLDLPINRTFGTNRGTAYILFDHEADAEAAISHMHEAQVDGATINVSIVLPRRKLSPPPPTARRGANIDPRIPMSGPRGGGHPGRGGSFNVGGGRRRGSPSGRYGPRSDVYRPSSRSPSRSPGAPPSRGGGTRYRSRSNGSYSSRSRSKSTGPRRRGGGGGRFEEVDDRRRSRSRSYDSYGGRSRSRSPRGHR